MESTPIIKRRKLNPTVNKPFKSPLRKVSNQDVTQRSSSPLATALARTGREESAQPTTTPAKASSPSQATPITRRPRISTGNSIWSATPAASSDPTTSLRIQDVTRSVRALESRVMQTRQDIDTLSQALRLATANTDAELDDLTAKWRKAARQAAEEVFAGARDKVNRMGGVGAWRERQQEMAENSRWDISDKHGDDEKHQEIFDEDGELVGLQKVEKAERFEDEWDYDAEDRKEPKCGEERDDDSFTMDMMLKMLNIDLELIGYDKQRQRWVG